LREQRQQGLQIEELHARVLVLLGDGDDPPQVGVDHLTGGPRQRLIRCVDLGAGAPLDGDGDTFRRLQRGEVARRGVVRIHRLLQLGSRHRRWLRKYARTGSAPCNPSI
jgi:hypothetical protein